MAINLTPLAKITTTATALGNLILVSPQDVIGYQPLNKPTANGPSNAPLSPAFVFHYEGEQTATLQSDITDHFIEDNTAIQDQIALKPTIVTTHGFIGELNDVTPYGLQTLQAVAEKLTVIGPYAPQLSVTAELAYTEALLLYETAQTAVDSAVSSWYSLAGGGGESVIDGQALTPQANQNKQQAAFQTFFGYWSERRLFTIQTPWAIFTNMAILTLRAIQGEETRVISDFELTFKAIRTTSTILLPNAPTFSGQAATQAAPATDLGTSTPVESTSLSDGISTQEAQP